MRSIGFSKATGAVLGAAMLVFGSSAAQAGQGYFVTVENTLDKEVQIEVRDAKQWYLYNFWNAPPLQPKETRTFYTESCRPFWGKCVDADRNKGHHSLELFFRTDFYKDFYDLTIYDVIGHQEAQCSNWRDSHSKVVPVKQGDQYAFKVKLLPGKMECTAK